MLLCITNCHSIPTYLQYAMPDISKRFDNLKKKENPFKAIKVPWRFNFRSSVT